MSAVQRRIVSNKLNRITCLWKSYRESTRRFVPCFYMLVYSLTCRLVRLLCSVYCPLDCKKGSCVSFYLFRCCVKLSWSWTWSLLIVQSLTVFVFFFLILLVSLQQRMKAQYEQQQQEQQHLFRPVNSNMNISPPGSVNTRLSPTQIMGHLSADHPASGGGGSYSVNRYVVLLKLLLLLLCIWENQLLSLCNSQSHSRVVVRAVLSRIAL